MNRNNDYFESIMRGLEDANQENIRSNKRSITIVPIKKYSKTEIKNIRKMSKMTQKMFASYLGVSIKTVEAWESGKNTPSGSSSRILSMFEINKDLALDYPFVIIN